MSAFDHIGHPRCDRCLLLLEPMKKSIGWRCEECGLVKL